MEWEANDRFVVAVQWHPEMMEGKVSTIRPIFNAFVDQCKVASANLTLINSDETIALILWILS